MSDSVSVTETSEVPRPLLVLTNDDGVFSPGLAALARSLSDLGDILIAAPLRQQSGVGRSLTGSGIIQPVELELGFQPIGAFGIEGAPAWQCARLSLSSRQDRLPCGGRYKYEYWCRHHDVGNAGAAIEAAGYQVPAIAVHWRRMSLITTPTAMK